MINVLNFTPLKFKESRQKHTWEKVSIIEVLKSKNS